MMWFLAVPFLQSWSAARQVLRTWAQSLETVLRDSHDPMSAPGCNARFLGLDHSEKDSELSAGMRDDSASLSQACRSPKPVTVCTGIYESLIYLRGMLSEIQDDPSLKRATIILVLAETVSGCLPSLIRRTSWGYRLILVSENDRVPLPGTMTLAELATQDTTLGWGQIVFELSCEAAFRGALQSFDAGEPLVVLWPDRLTQSLPLHIFCQPQCFIKPL